LSAAALYIVDIETDQPVIDKLVIEAGFGLGVWGEV